MANKYLYGKLPLFDGDSFMKFLKEAPEHEVKHNCISTKNQNKKKIILAGSSNGKARRFQR